jgi:hypothetical protein
MNKIETRDIREKPECGSGLLGFGSIFFLDIRSFGFTPRAMFGEEEERLFLCI